MKTFPQPRHLWPVAVVLAVVAHGSVAYCVLRNSQFEPVGKGADGIGIELTLATAGGAIPTTEKPVQPKTAPDTPPTSSASKPSQSADVVKAPEAAVIPPPVSPRLPRPERSPEQSKPVPETPKPEPVLVQEAPTPPENVAERESFDTPSAESPRATTADQENPVVEALAEHSHRAPSEQSGNAANSASGGSAGVQTESVYLAQVKAWLAQHKTYPRIAAMRRQEGVVLMHIVIDRGGNIIDYRVKEKSGHRLLDKEARKMMERASPVPPIPESIHREALELVIPVEFFLV